MIIDNLFMFHAITLAFLFQKVFNFPLAKKYLHPPDILLFLSLLSIKANPVFHER